MESNSPSKTEKSELEEEQLNEKSPLPFRGLAGDAHALRGSAKSPNPFDRKSSLMLLGSQLSAGSLRGKLHRSESLFDPPKVSDLVIEKHQQEFKPDSSIFLKERAIIKYKIQSGAIDEAKEYLQENFSEFFDKN